MRHAVMKSTRYRDLPDDPDEVDYLELELERIYLPSLSLTRTNRCKKWARKNNPQQWTRKTILIVTLLALSLVVAISYSASWMVSRLGLVGFVRLENGNIKVQEMLDGSQGSVQFKVAGTTVNIDGSSSAAKTPGGLTKGTNVTTTTATNLSVSLNQAPTQATDKISEPTQQPNPAATNKTSEVPPPAKPAINNTTVAEVPGGNRTGQGPTPATNTTISTPKPAANNTSSVQQDDGKVSIQNSTFADNEPLVPIIATFYNSVGEGPKSCRGHVIATIQLPKPAQPVTPTQAQCYNFPNQQVSGCAQFMGNKIDGCQANVYAMTGCQTYINTMAFMPENKPVGGYWKSVRVQCGLPEPDPATLGKPPGMDLISSVTDNDKKGG